MLKKIKRAKGFSTVELLIAMAILLSAFTVSLLLSSAQSLSVDAQGSNEATSIVRKLLESEQSLGRKDFKLVVATTSKETLNASVYTKSVSVSQSDPLTKKIVATVTWPGTYGRSLSTSLSALLTNFTDAVGGNTCNSVLTDSAGLHGNWKTPTVGSVLLATLIGDAAAAAYAISDIDVYEHRLYISAAGGSTPLGPRNPSVGVDTNTPSVGTLTWSNPSRITAKDSSNATLATNGTAISHYLKATNFGFTIPPGATILGIKVDIFESASGNTATNAVVDSQVRLVKQSGALGSMNQASGVRWSTTAGTDAVYGSISDLWGESDWTPAAINSSNFGAVLAAAGNVAGANRTANVDSIQITVYYSKQFYIADVSNPASPIYLGALSTSTQSGLNAVAVATSSSINIAVAATNSSSGFNQLQVIDVKNPLAPFTKSTYPPALGSGMGRGVGSSIFYKDGYAYVGLTTGAGGPEFNVVDVSSPSLPIWRGGYNVGNTVNALYIKDGYAYISTNDLSRELIILNITNPANPTFVASYNAVPDISGWGFGRAIFTMGDTVYVGRSWTNSATIAQFLSLDASSTPILLSPAPNSKTLGTNFSLNGLLVRDSLAFLLLGSQTSGGQIQIINATSTAQFAAPIALPSAGGVGGVALDCEGNYVYAASLDSTGRGWITNMTGI